MKRLLGLLLVCLIGVATIVQADDRATKPWEYFLGDWQSGDSEPFVHKIIIYQPEDGGALSLVWDRRDDPQVDYSSYNVDGGQLTLFPDQNGRLKWGIVNVWPWLSSEDPESYIIVERLDLDDPSIDALYLHIFSYGAKHDPSTYTENSVTELIVTRVLDPEE